MFTQRLNILLDRLNIKNSDLAELMGRDRSNISRLRSGSRVLRPDGSAAARLAEGIYRYAERQNRLSVLASLISVPEGIGPDEMKNHIVMWLFGGSERRGAELFPAGNRVPFRSFGEKLDTVMLMVNLSNVRFSKLINMDASNISRFRNGLRTPRSNPRTVDAICAVLLDKVREQGKLDQLSELTGIDAETLGDIDAGLRSFRSWLCDFDSDDTGTVVERLLSGIDRFSIDTGVSLPSFEEASAGADRSQSVYTGIAGLQNAVIRFLTDTANDGAERLYLYSDQSMDWMTGDKKYFLRWLTLMRQCLAQGVKIRIIHNIDRKLPEMIDAINSWLPLYMTGMIEPYWCAKGGDTRFSHTLFLNPGNACVEGCNVTGCEQTGLFRYHTDKDVLSAYMTQYNTLLASSSPLMKITTLSEGERTALTGSRTLTYIARSLSLASMPEELVARLLDRSGLDNNAKNWILGEWARRRDSLAEMASSGGVWECVSLPEISSIESGEVTAAVPGCRLFYTKEEYALHIENIIRLMEQYPDYHFIPTGELTFHSSRVFVTENTVSVSRIASPQLTFVLNHPALISAFSAYSQRIIGRSRRERSAVIKQLRQCIQ